MKTALVLGGGGAKGSYELGVWKALRELDVQIDIAVGTSVGAINSAIIAQGDFETAQKLWNEISTDKVLNIADLHQSENYTDKLKSISTFTADVVKNKGVDTAPLRKILETWLDEEKIRNSNIDYGLVAFSLTDLKPLSVYIENIEKGSLIDYIMASAAFFPAMQAQQIKDKYYIDGGYADNVPINLAAEKGAERIIAVDLGAPGVRHEYEGDARVILIEPTQETGDILKFEHDIIVNNIQMGYLDTMKAFNKYRGKVYSFSDKCDAMYVRSLAERSHIVYKKIFLQSGHRFDILRRKARKTVKLRKKRNTLLSLYQNVQDITGSLLGLSALKVYTEESFNAELIEKLKSQKGITFSEIKKLINDLGILKTAEEIRKSIEKISKKSVVASFYEYMKNSETSAESEGFLRSLAFVFTEEFIAAMYIYLISEKELI